MLSDGFQKELKKFDTERVLPAWDGLVRGQQARLEALKVPTMFVTSEAGDVEVRIIFPINRRRIPFFFSILARISRSCKTRFFLSEAAQGRARLGGDIVHERSSPVIARCSSCPTAPGCRYGEMPQPSPMNAPPRCDTLL